MKTPSMNASLTQEIQRYLIECGENEAAEFLSDCDIENYYRDSVSGNDEEYERDLYDITIFLPVKKYRALGTETEKMQTAIRDAISEFAYASGRLVYKFDWQPYLKKEEDVKLEIKAIDVTKLLDDNRYVVSKLQILKDSIRTAPHLAIGTSKELIEVCCKGILNHHAVIIDPKWELARLVKETNKVLNFGAEKHDEKFQQSISLITGGLSNIVHGVTEIRNKFGSGHGHALNFQELDDAYTQLVVYCSIELITFYLRVFNAQKNK